MALIPSSGATSAGFWPSTSVCHSTSCQRSGSEAKARAAAAFSKPSTAVSRNGTPGSNGVRSSVVCSRDGRADPVDVEAADGGQQVGAEREVGAAAALEHDRAPWRTPRRPGRRRRGPRHQLAAEPAGGLDVAREQLAVGVDVAAAHGRDQLGVAGPVDASTAWWLTTGPTVEQSEMMHGARPAKSIRESIAGPRHGSTGRAVPRQARPTTEGATVVDLRRASGARPRAIPRQGGSCPRTLRRHCRRASRQWGRPSLRDRGAVAACESPAPRSPATGSRSRRPWTPSRRPRALVGGTDPRYATSGRSPVAWSEATLGYLHQLSCEDPLTGLASLAHLRSRSPSSTAAGRRRRRRATHALVVVDRRPPWPGARARRDAADPAMRAAQLGETARTVFAGGETIGRVGAGPRRRPRRPRRPAGRRVELLRRMLDGTRATRRPRVWIEGLPAPTRPRRRCSTSSRALRHPGVGHRRPAGRP